MFNREELLYRAQMFLDYLAVELSYPNVVAKQVEITIGDKNDVCINRFWYITLSNFLMEKEKIKAYVKSYALQAQKRESPIKFR